MKLSPAEKKILEIIFNRQLARKSEIINIMKSDGFRADKESLKGIVETTTKTLIKKNYITPVNPIGGTCFAITKDGSTMIENLE